jgi:hypothetical protein
MNHIHQLIGKIGNGNKYMVLVFKLVKKCANISFVLEFQGIVTTMNNYAETGIYGGMALSLITPYFICQNLIILDFDVVYARQIQIVFTFLAISMLLLGIALRMPQKTYLDFLSEYILQCHLLLLVIIFIATVCIRLILYFLYLFF